MADTVRNVLINLKIQADLSKLQLPDMSSVVKQARELRDTINAVYKTQDLASKLVANAAAAEAQKSQAAIIAAKKAKAETEKPEAGPKVGDGKSLIQSLREQQIAMTQGAAAAKVYSIEQQNIEAAAKATAINLVRQNDEIQQSSVAKAAAAASAKRQKDEEQRLMSALQQQSVAMRQGSEAAKIYAIQHSNMSRDAKAAAIAIIQETSAIERQGKVAPLMAASADGLKMAGEGALHLARGVMLLNSASEEEIQALARKFAMYTAALDVYKGSVDLVKGLATASSALTAAHAAATTGAVAQTVATGTLGASMVAARTAALGLWASLGPLGWGVLAVTAAGAGGISMWNRYREAQKSARAVTVQHSLDIAFAAAEYRKAHKALQDYTLAQQAAANKSAAASQQHELEMASIVASPVSGEHKTELQRAAEEAASQQDVFRRKMRENDAERARQRKIGLVGSGLNEAMASGALDDVAFEKQFERLKKAATFSQVSMQIQQHHINNARQNAAANPENKDLQQEVLKLEMKRADQINAQKAQMSSLQALAQSMVGIEKSRLAVITEQRSTIQKQIDGYRQMHEANRAAIREEENRGKSLAQRFGALDAPQQARLKQLASAANSAGGIEKLSRAEQEELRSSGFADAAFSHLDLKRGKAAGFDDLAKNLGTFLPGTTDQAEGQRANETRLDFLLRDRNTLQQGVQQAERQMMDLLKEQEDQKLVLAERMKKATDLAPLIQDLERMIEIYNQHLETIRAEIAKLGFNVERGVVTRR